MICEDWWFPAVAETLAESGAELLLSINGSPFEDGKPARRIALAVERVVETGLAYVFLAMVGGQDELVFDGASFVLNPDRSWRCRCRSSTESVTLTEWRRDGDRLVCAPQPPPPEPGRLDAIYRCMMLGLADYVRKNRFPGVLLGLSGGIDSALSAAVAVDALGAGPGALRDAAVAPTPASTRWTTPRNAPGCWASAATRCRSRRRWAPSTSALAPLFAGRPVRHDGGEHPVPLARADPDGAVQQVRRHGADHRQQERDVGRLRHAVRRHVRRLLGAEGRLQDDRVRAVPLAQRPPSGGRAGPARRRDAGPGDRQAALRRAEARPDRPGLAAALRRAGRHPVRPGGGRAVGRRDGGGGHDRATVLRVWRMLDRAEYKRRQAPPGVKITARAFGRDRRYPITNGYTGLVA